MFHLAKKFPNFFVFVFLTCNLLLASCSVFAQQPTEEWVKRYSWGTHASGNSIRLDSSGDIYVLVSQTSDSTHSDIGLVKYNSAGTQLWNRYYNSSGNKADFAEAFAVTAGGDVYIAGTSNLNFYQNIVTVKFNSNGVLQWVKVFDSGYGYDFVYDMGLDGSNNIVIAGQTGDGNTATTLSVKYNSNGDSIWVRKFSQLSTINDIHKIAIDDSNNVYLAGLTSTFHSADYLVLKYNPVGTLQWYSTYNTFYDYVDHATNICVDANRNVYVVGTNSVLPDHGNTLVKLNSSGVLQWARLFTGLVYASGGCQRPGGLLTTPDGAAIYYTTECPNEQNRGEIVTLKYAANGDSVWIRRFPQGVQGTPIDGPIIKFDQNYDVYLAAYKYDSLSSNDYLALKYLKDGTLQWSVEYNNGLVPNSNDGASDLIIDKNQKVYVTGGSYRQSSPVYYDAVTIKYNQPVGINLNENGLPKIYSIRQNYPNPFNSMTVIDYSLSNLATVKIAVYNILGQVVFIVVNEKKSAGFYSKAIEMGNLPSGIYFYSLIVDGKFVDTKKMLMVK